MIDKWLFESKLKQHSTDEIEKAIAKSISELLGEDLEANIKFINYNPNNQDVNIRKPVEIHITICEPAKDFFK